MPAQSTEDIISGILVMTRPQLVSLLQETSCKFIVDFSVDYLNSLRLERLRHVALAVCLHNHAA